MKRGQRLTYEGKTVARKHLITDGPFGESKEVIGGYWFILAHNLDEAVQSPKGTPVSSAACFSKSGPSIHKLQPRTIPEAPGRARLGFKKFVPCLLGIILCRELRQRSFKLNGTKRFLDLRDLFACKFVAPFVFSMPCVSFEPMPFNFVF